MGKLVVRVFVEVDTAEAAADLKCMILGAIDDLGDLKSESIQPYFKIPEYFEISLVLERLQGEGAATTTSSALGKGWISAGGQCLVWNAGADCDFIVPEARWAMVEPV